MIQDIAPACFSLSYDLHAPKDNSAVCVFSGKTILGSLTAAGALCLPRFCELNIDAEDCWASLSISGRDYFWYRRTLKPCGGDYEYLSLRRIMSAPPQYEAFAAHTAHHLAAWYAPNRYCGRCGRPLVRDGMERALLCPECGNLIYPRINPVIIAGVTDGDRMLLTKYAPAHAQTKLFALVAGFCEIGETAEDTVRREVFEEVGLRVKNIRYYDSQPWGIDGNLSLGFFAELDGSDEIHMEEDELSQALWVPRTEIPRQSNTLALTWQMMDAFRSGKV